MSILISVIIPTYNHGSTILRAIRSIQQQKVSEYEIIVVDDGSTDNTKQLLAEIQHHDFYYFYQKNSGVCAARNYGAKKAHGNHLLFLDADDWLSENYLQSSVAFLQAPECKLLLGYIAYLDDNHQEVKRVLPWQTGTSYSHSLPGAFVMATDLFDKMGGYDVKLTYSENTDLFMRLSWVGWVTPSQVMVNEGAGVLKEMVNEHDRSLKYAKKRFDSATYFLAKHKVFFNKSLPDFRNYKRIQAVSAIQIGDRITARKALWELLVRDAFSFKTWMQYGFILFFPTRARNFYSGSNSRSSFPYLRLMFRSFRDLMLLFTYPRALQKKKISEAVGDSCFEKSEKKGLPLVIAFAGLGDQFEFVKSMSHRNANVIFIRDLSHQWYLNKINNMGDTVQETTQFLSDKIREYQPNRIITLGSSAGGYAALLYGALLNANTILAFSPQTFRSKKLCLRYFDYRWLDRVVDIYEHRGNREYLDVKPFVKNSNATIHIFYDRGNRLDRVHAERISAPTLSRYAYQFGGHVLVSRLKELGQLDDILSDKLQLP